VLHFMIVDGDEVMLCWFQWLMMDLSGCCVVFDGVT